MNRLNIFWRMLLAACVPVVLVSVLMALVFLNVRLLELRQTEQARWQALAERLAADSEGSLFAGDQAQMAQNLQVFLGQADVQWAELQDVDGRRLQAAGVRPASTPGLQQAWRLDDEAGLWLRVAVQTRPFMPTSDLQPYALSASPHRLGFVLVYFNKQSLRRLETRLRRLAFGVALAGLTLGVLLGWLLSTQAVKPMRRLAQTIERLGQGDFTAVQVPAHENAAHDPLASLQRVLQQAAGQLHAVQDTLTQQVEQATESLRIKVEEAQQANAAKSRFLAMASHDLRQPTHALGLLLARLSQARLDQEAQVLVQQLEASVDALRVLLDGLLDLSRLESGGYQVRHQALALAPLFARLEQDLGEIARSRGLRLRLRPADLWVQSDPVLLYQILLNLTGNALSFTPRGGVLVSARWCQHHQQVRIQVWDTGVGIAPRDQDLVFQEFVRLKHTDAAGVRGLGLGLAIVRRANALLGHQLELTSRVGAGTCFSLLLPAALPQAPSALAPPPVMQSNSVLQGLRVLVLEDDQAVAQAMHSLLTGWGLEVCLAQDAAHAMGHLAEGWRPALVISDFDLGAGPDGVAAIAALRERLGAALPACLVSGDPGAAEAAQGAGLPLLDKPVRPAKLRSLLTRLVQRSA